MRGHVHPFVLGESSARLSRPYCGPCSVRTRSARVGYSSTKVAERQILITVSLRHVNRWRAQWQLNGRKGRPRQTEGRPPVASAAEVVRVTPHLSCVGVHLFAHWLDQQDAFGPVVAQLTQTVEA